MSESFFGDWMTAKGSAIESMVSKNRLARERRDIEHISLAIIQTTRCYRGRFIDRLEFQAILMHFIDIINAEFHANRPGSQSRNTPPQPGLVDRIYAEVDAARSLHKTVSEASQAIAYAVKAFTKPVLSTADRDAIREALKDAIEYVDSDNSGKWAKTVHNSLTAALGLIGEG